MSKSATDVMQEIIFSAVLDSIAALKAGSKGVPNTLLRDINALHANTTFTDLPAELQTALSASVRAAFTRLLKEGYSVSPGQPAPPPRDPRPRPSPGDAGPRARPPFHRGGGDPGGTRPRGGAPGRRPKPR